MPIIKKPKNYRKKKAESEDEDDFASTEPADEIERVRYDISLYNQNN